MIKRLLDIILSTVAILVLFPIFLLVAIGIKISSKGSIFYTADRAGLNGAPFKLIKFRSMHVASNELSTITLNNDPRIFKFGNFIRTAKLDELPQLLNIIKGDMSIVGPRPEDITIVENHYTEKNRISLSMRPGLSSPGSIYNYTHGHQYIDDSNAEESYINDFLPVKLQIENYYIKHQSLLYDFEIIYRTILVIIQKSFGKENFLEPKELIEENGKQ